MRPVKRISTMVMAALLVLSFSNLSCSSREMPPKKNDHPAQDNLSPGDQDKNHHSEKQNSVLSLIEYTAAGNSTADIHLNLFSDHTFIMKFQSLLDESGELYRFPGTWQRTGNDISLIFTPHHPPELSALFDNKYVTGDFTYRFPNDSTVVFDANQERIMIWGVACVKSPK